MLNLDRWAVSRSAPSPLHPPRPCLAPAAPAGGSTAGGAAVGSSCVSVPAAVSVPALGTARGSVSA